MKIIYQNISLLKHQELKRKAKTLFSYIRKLQKIAKDPNYRRPESIINLPFDERLRGQVQDVAQKKALTSLKYIVVIGIGGSNLGTKAIYDALWGYFDVIEPRRFPKIIFADTSDPDFLGRLQQFLKNEISSPDEVLVNVVSKSGATTETLENLQVLEGHLENARQRLVITTKANSKLAKTAKERALSCLTIPTEVGGRFSVFSAVGLFPLAAAGANTNSWLAGAREMRDRCLNQKSLENPAVLSATILYQQSQKGKVINDNFFFHPELESLGKWYRQLMAESLGKDGQGITPTVSIGSTDLHSMAQLYLDGPQDKFTTFVWGEHQKNAILPSPSSLVTNLNQFIKNKTPAQVMQSLYDGVKTAYQKKQRPFMEVVLPDLTEYSLGAWMQFKMMEIIFLGKLFGVNTFNQPAVEIYKREARRILTRN